MPPRGDRNFNYSASVNDTISPALDRMRQSAQQSKAALEQHAALAAQLFQNLNPVEDLYAQLVVRLRELQATGGLPGSLLIDVQALQKSGVDASAAMSAFERALMQVDREADQAARSIQRTSVAAEGMNRSITHFQTAAHVTSNFSGNLGYLEKNAVGFFRHVSDGNRYLVDMASTMATMTMGIPAFTTGALAAGVAIISIGKALQDATGEAMHFQTMLQEMQNNTGVTTEALGQMSEGIKREMTRTNASLEQLGEGLAHTANFGYSAADGVKILDQAMQSASTTGGNTAKTADLLASTMHHYRLGAEDAAHVTDILHVAAQRSNSTFEQFAEHANRATAVAANLNVSLDETAAALAALTRNGFTSAEAQTQFVNILTHLIHPAAQAVDALEELSRKSGVDLVSDFSASALATKGLTGIMEDLQQAFKNVGLSQAEATQQTMLFLNAQRGGLGMSVLLGKGWKDYTSNLEQFNLVMQGKIRPTHDGYVRSLDTAGYQLGILGNKFKLAAIEIGTAMLPTLLKLIQAAGDTLDTLMAVGRFVGDVLGPVFQVLGVVLEGVGSVLNAIGTGWSAFADAVTGKTESASKAVDEFGNSMTPLADNIERSTRSGADSISSNLGDGTWDTADMVDEATIGIADSFDTLDQNVSDSVDHTKDVVLTGYQEIVDKATDALTTVDSQADASVALQAEAAANAEAAVTTSYENIAAAAVAHAASVADTEGSVQSIVEDVYGKGYDEQTQAAIASLLNQQDAEERHEQAVEVIKQTELDTHATTVDEIKKSMQDQLQTQIEKYQNMSANAAMNTGAMAAAWQQSANDTLTQIGRIINGINLLNQAMSSVGGKRAPTAGMRNVDGGGPNNPKVSPNVFPGGNGPAIDPYDYLSQFGNPDEGMYNLPVGHGGLPEGTDPETGLVYGESPTPDKPKKPAKPKKPPKDRTPELQERASERLQEIANERALAAAHALVEQSEAKLKAVTAGFNETLKGLNTQLENIKAEEKSFMDPLNAQIKKAENELKAMKETAENSLHAIDEEIYKNTQELKRLEKEAAVALKPLEAAVKTAEKALRDLRAEGERVREATAHALYPLQDQLYDINQRSAAALEPLQAEITVLQDQLYDLGKAEQAALTPINDEIFEQSNRLRDLQIHLTEVAKVYDERLVPLQRELAEITREQQQMDRNRELRELGLAATNITGRLQNAREGTREYRELMNMQAEAQQKYGLKARQFSVEDQIKAIEDAKKASVESATAQVEAQQKIVEALNHQRELVQHSFELQRRGIEMQLDAKQREMELAQRAFEAEAALVEKKIAAIQREQELYDRQQHDREVAAQHDLETAQGNLDAERERQEAKQQAIRDTLDLLEEQRTVVAHDATEAQRLKEKEIGDLKERKEAAQIYFDNLKTGIENKIDQTEKDKKSAEERAKSEVDGYKDQESALKDYIDQKKDEREYNKAIAEYAAIYKVSLSEAEKVFRNMVPNMRDVSTHTKTASDTFKNDFIPTLNTLSTETGTKLDGVYAEFQKTFDADKQATNPDDNILWILNGRNQDGFFAWVNFFTDQGLGLNGMRGQWNNALTLVFNDVDGKLTTEATAVGTQATPVGQAIIDGFTKGAQDILKNQALQAAVAKAVTDAIEAGKKAAQSSSPSRLAAEKVGKPITEGIGVGVLEGVPTLQRAMARAVGGVFPGAAGAYAVGGYLPSFASGVGVSQAAGIGTQVNHQYITIEIPSSVKELPETWQGWRPHIRNIDRAVRAELGQPLATKG